ncbi:MAG: SGNH/GDSL hydrolase family protein [Verrucomicrobia bacterium]|nr:SGNH/GDSL hydrolase family protein [Verrucomicrobiota bacterium]
MSHSQSSEGGQLRFLRIFVGSVVVFTTLCLTCIYVVNPEAAFPPRVFEPLYLLDRKMKMTLFADAIRHGGGMDVLVLGSSRSRKIDARSTDSPREGLSFNFAVSNATPEDFLAIYRWVRQKKGPVERLVRFIREIKSAATYRTMSDILRVLTLRLRGEPPIYSFRTDGILEYHRWDAERAEGKFDTAGRIKGCAATTMAAMDGMKTLSSRREARLESLLNEARSDGVAVTLFLTPYEPGTEEQLRRQSPYGSILPLLRIYLNGLAARYNVPFLDFTAVSVPAGGDTFWYDCVHYSDSYAARISQVVVKGTF